jgi:hypothetical protein
MNTADQESQTTKQSFPPGPPEGDKRPQTAGDKFAPLRELAQSVIAKGERSRALLSPWVGRSLAEISPPPGPPKGGERPQTGTSPHIGSIFEIEPIWGVRSTAFSVEQTRALVERVFRQVENNRVWRSEAGPVAPVALDRFAGEILERHRPIADKYRVTAPQKSPEGEHALPLAAGTSPQGVGGQMSPGSGESARQLEREASLAGLMALHSPTGSTTQRASERASEPAGQRASGSASQRQGRRRDAISGQCRGLKKLRRVGG